LRLANGLAGYAAYLFQTLWPDNLAVFYPYPARVPGWEIAGAGLLLLFVTALAVGLARRFPYLPVGWLWFLGMLVPVIGIVQVGGQARADRYTYLPQIGLCLLVAWGARDLAASRRRWRPLLGAGALMAIAALSVCAWKQTAHWRNSETLWNHALACTPNNAFAHDNLGDIFILKGRPEEAIGQFQLAIRIKPDDAEAYYNLGVILASGGKDVEALEDYRLAVQFNPNHVDAHNNLGSLLAKQGQIAEAIEQFQQAVQVKADGTEARYNLGVALAAQGRREEAAGQFRQVIQFKPDHAAAHYHLANLLAAEGRREEAVEHYRRAVESMPNLVPAHYQLGVAWQTQRNFGAAITEYQKVLELYPGHLPARLNLAWLLATCPEASIRNGPRAVELARPAVQLAGTASPQVFDTLAAAYAEAGRFSEAVQAARQACDLAGAQPEGPLASAILARLRLYEANTPYHEKP
jgi:tetratricopeptide (TPR) repeat protein